MAMLALILLFIPFLGLSISVGTDCSRDSSYCGDPFIEKLICEDGLCKGGYLNNACGPTKLCSKGFYCNSFGICDRCIPDCAVCTNSYTCRPEGCFDGYFYNSTEAECLSLPINCATGTSATTCTRCKPGFYVDKGLCKTGPKDCVTPASSTNCEKCVDGMYWDGKACTTGPSNCLVPLSSSDCEKCMPGYYLFKKKCFKGPEDCKEVRSIGECTECVDGYMFDKNNQCFHMNTANCKIATDSETCIECKPGYFLNKVCGSALPHCTVAKTATKCGECDSGYYLDVNGNCQPCYSPTKCKICWGPLMSDCESSVAEYFATKYYGCQECAVHCSNCDTSGKDKCDICETGYVVNDDKTLCDKCAENCDSCTTAGKEKCDKCSAGYVRNPSTQLCDKCIDDCDECTTAGSGCSKCSKGYTYVTSVCTKCAENCDACDTTGAGKCDTCSEGYIRNSVTKVCDQCADNCAKCASAGAGKCDTCKEGYVVNSDTDLCEECSEKCANCVNSGPGHCDDCVNGYYLDSTTGKCTENPKGCATPLSSERCSACSPGYTQKYDEPCQPCESTNCIECPSEDPTICTTCKPGYYKDPSTSKCSDSICTTNCFTCKSATKCSLCEDGFYLTSTDTCSACPANCKKCKAGDVCDECLPNYYLKNTGTCGKCTDYKAETCEPPPRDIKGNYIATSYTKTLKCFTQYFESETCGNLMEGCKKAISPNKCSECTAGYYLSTSYTCQRCSVSNCKECTETVCSECDDDAIPVLTDDKITRCDSCVPPCATCENSVNSCINCMEGYTRQGNTCVPCTSVEGSTACNCGERKFWDGTSCASCMEHCKICSNKSTCDQCDDRFYFNGEVCELASVHNCKTALSKPICAMCSGNTFYQTSDNTCQACNIPDCVSCASKNKCELCKSGLYPTLNGTCTNCSTALSNCKTCVGPTVCDQCNDGFFWNTANKNCSECTTGCSTCGNSTHCMVCKQGFYLISDYTCKKCGEACKICNRTNTCAECEEGYYFDEGLKKCTHCSPLCQTCDGPGDNACTTCIENAELISNDTDRRTCACKIGYLYNSVGKLCEPGTISKGQFLVSFLGIAIMMAVILL